MEQGDLFLGPARARLRALGWGEAGALFGAPAWKRPDDGAILEEAEALGWLDRFERARGREGGSGDGQA